MGESQVGVVSETLAQPFVVLVEDSEGNPVERIDVIFELLEGGGDLEGSSTVVRTTDADGIAQVRVRLGPAAGLNSNVAQARFEGLDGLPVILTASGTLQGPSERTSVEGVVLDNTNMPVPDARVRIADTALESRTDEEGKFRIDGAPVGHVHLIVDGRTTTRPGVWPVLAFDLHNISGQSNSVGMPIFLLPIDVENARLVGGDQDTVLTLTGVPGFELTLFANSVTCPGGSSTCDVSVTQVHRDKVPMPPPRGAAPRLVLTVQPPGIRFDPPARVKYPNIEALAPGQVVDFFSFDHDLGQFVSVGTATVDEEGAFVITDPGFGIREGGWQYPQANGGDETTCTGPGAPFENFINPLVGSNGELMTREPGQGDGRFSLEGEYRTNVDGTPRPHRGVDERGSVEQPVVAAADGVVEDVKWDPDNVPPGGRVSEKGGNMVVINHGEGRISISMHMTENIMVNIGDTVRQGQQIGELDTSGNARKPHLHFEVQLNGQPVDPTGIVQRPRTIGAVAP
jgi:hypothetical protein